MKDISVVIPVYNEAGNLPSLAEKLKKALSSLGKNYECIFVDDGSTDNSYDILEGLKERMDFIKLIKLKKNFGQTAAMSAGFDYAEGDVIITIDADLQNDPGDIPMLISKLDEGFDIVSGWRDKRKDPLLTRKIPSFMANKLISFLAGVKLHDFGCTLKAYRKETIKSIRLYGDMHRFIPAVASSSGASITELRIRHHSRRCGHSKYGALRVLKVLLDLVAVKFFLSYSTNPMRIFGLTGLISIFGAACSLFITIILKLAKQIDMTGNPLLYLTVALAIIGTQFILMGILGEIMIRTYYECQHKRIYTIDEIK